MLVLQDYTMPATLYKKLTITKKYKKWLANIPDSSRPQLSSKDTPEEF